MMSDITALLDARTSGMSLPQALYTSDAAYHADLEHVFYRHWLFAGHSCDIPNPGDFFVVPVGHESIVVIRDRDGQVYAHFNVCRHRGSKIALQDCGNAKTLLCPYHQWAYSPNGRLVGARLMGEQFDKDSYRLRSAHVRDLAGLLFVCLADEPPDFDRAVADVTPQLRPHGLANAQVIARHRYDVEANWKVVIENNRECYHCQVSHPEFCLSNYDYGVNGDPRSDAAYSEVLTDAYRRWHDQGLHPAEVSFPGGAPYRVSRLPLRPGFVTESMDGQPVAPPMGELPNADVGSLRLISLPNLWAHANGDYAMTTRLTPTGPHSTRIDVAFLVRGDAQAGHDFDPDAVAYVWKMTSEEDWELCENNHAGIRSRAYQPGPLSPLTENSVEAFYGWYETQLREGVAERYTPTYAAQNRSTQTTYR
ncbi:MAG: aromatic ring-hydroxylating dioxygenase subunit alpha [Trueperaceae bacterium]|nr:aromatic ring-hydroxylating dioxygenase subunit alpha [Trueperaceae bacterium]